MKHDPGGNPNQIIPFKKSDLQKIKTFADRTIGLNYYSLEELETICERSQRNERMCSLALVDRDQNILGIRISYPPGNWSKGKGRGIHPEKWNVPFEKVGYFQSLFLDPKIQGKGLGQELSRASMKILKEAGASAIVCHSWKESPHDSSGKYLRKLGFELVETHPLYWKEVDYVCVRCGNPCLCTAEEMICYLD